MKKFPKGMQPFVDLALRIDNWKESYEATRSITGVSPEVAEWFRTEYGAGGASMENAWKQFHADVRGGNYVMEGEMNFIKKIIREELLLHEAIDQYKKLFDKFDYWYMMSDDPSKYSRGSQQAQTLQQLYAALPDNEKQEAAIYFQSRVADFRDGSTHTMNVKMWNPAESFDPDSFDGIHYRKEEDKIAR